MNNIKRKLAFAFTAIALISNLLMPGLALPALAYSSYPLQPTDTEIVNALNYLRTTQTADGNIGGLGTSAWAVMAIAAVGEDPHDWGNPSIVDYLKDNWDNLDWNKATDLERSILAITAAGEDPYNFGGVDYVAGLKNLHDGTQIGDSSTLNDDFWGILALIAAGEPQDSPMVTSTAAFIETNQGFDGGWSWAVNGDSDVDDTAAALMALVAAGGASDPTIVDYAVFFMQYNQGPNGGFQYDAWGAENLASTVWAVDAIVAAGQDPTGADWTTGATPVDYLLSLQDTDGGFKWKADSGSNKEWMTSYAIPALLGKPYPVAVYEAPPPAEPTIAFSPSSLSFTAIEGEANPADQILEIRNSGTGTLNWQVSDNANWLSLSPTSGSSTGEVDEVTASVDISGMSAGDYSATIAIQDSEATNSPQTVSVSLHIVTEPTIAFSPSSFSFTAIEGDGNPADQTLEIRNSGTGTLNWQVSDNANWLSLSPTSGSSTGEVDEVTVSVDISGMSASDYSATIAIQDPEATNSPQTVSVSLHIVTGSSYYSLTTNVSPAESGSISLNIAQPDEGYLEGSKVELTASPAAGYTFGCWTGNLSGSTNPAIIVMSSSKSVIANFVLFDIGDLTNVGLVIADPEVTSVSVDSYPVEDLSNIPSDLDVQLACVVNPAGSGTFSLHFTDISNASSVKVYKVTDSGWTEIEDVTITGNAVEFTLDVSDPIIALCFPAPPKPPPASQSSPPLAEQINWPILSGAIAGVIVIGLLIFFLARKRAY